MITAAATTNTTGQLELELELGLMKPTSSTLPYPISGKVAAKQTDGAARVNHQSRESEAWFKFKFQFLGVSVVVVVVVRGFRNDLFEQLAV